MGPAKAETTGGWSSAGSCWRHAQECWLPAAARQWGGVGGWDAPPAPGLHFAPPADRHMKWPFGLASFTV